MQVNFHLDFFLLQLVYDNMCGSVDDCTRECHTHQRRQFVVFVGCESPLSSVAHISLCLMISVQPAEPTADLEASPARLPKTRTDSRPSAPVGFACTFFLFLYFFLPSVLRLFCAPSLHFLYSASSRLGESKGILNFSMVDSPPGIAESG